MKQSDCGDRFGLVGEGAEEARVVQYLERSQAGRAEGPEGRGLSHQCHRRLPGGNLAPQTAAAVDVVLLLVVVAVSLLLSVVVIVLSPHSRYLSCLGHVRPRQNKIKNIVYSGRVSPEPVHLRRCWSPLPAGWFCAYSRSVQLVGCMPHTCEPLSNFLGTKNMKC